MPMNANDIEVMIKAALPDAAITIRDLAGDGDHYAAEIVSESFRGKTRVQCGFSGQLVQILDYLGVDYKGINVLENDDLRQGIKDYAQWPTIPQLYVKGEFVGGCDIVREMFQAKELQTHMKDAGITVRETA